MSGSGSYDFRFVDINMSKRHRVRVLYSDVVCRSGRARDRVFLSKWAQFGRQGEAPILLISIEARSGSHQVTFPLSTAPSCAGYRVNSAVASLSTRCSYSLSNHVAYYVVNRRPTSAAKARTAGQRLIKDVEQGHPACVRRAMAGN